MDEYTRPTQARHSEETEKAFSNLIDLPSPKQTLSWEKEKEKICKDNELKEKIKSILLESGVGITEETENAIDQTLEVSEGNSDITMIMKWFEERRRVCQIKTEVVGINELGKWSADQETGVISHETGKFFSIIGVKVSGAEDREVSSWAQPLMKQQECGILGIITKKIDGIKYYLLYAKYEPGNIHKLQLSPRN